MKFQDFETHLSKLLHDYSSKNYLLAVSGGVDSMVLLDLFEKANLNFQIAHCHFGLRQEADQEEQLIIQTCEQKEIKLHSKRFDTKRFSTDNNLSIQEAARELRYRFFENICLSEKLDYLVTAHHANDNLETTIYKLSKGTGIKGLRGILPISGNLLRPLLPYSKKEIYTYAKSNDVTWLEDKSNSDNKYKRNFIRNEIVPQLQKINPIVEKSFFRTSEKLRTVENVYNNYIIQLQTTLIHKSRESFVINKSELIKGNITPYLLEDILSEFSFAVSDCEELIDKLDSHGQIYNSTDYKFTLLNDRHQLVINSVKTESKTHKNWLLEDTKFKLDKITLYKEIVAKDHLNFNKSPNHAYFDAEKITTSVLIRNWENGDKLKPFGFKGSQKVSDILINNKISLTDKKDQLVLEYKNQIIWVIGVRTSNLYSVTSKTKSVLHFYVEKNL